MYIKMNKKGFTLVELLITIAIVGLVIGFSVYGIISLINRSEDKTVVINETGVKEAARLYSAEIGSDSWKKTEYDYDAFCVTISELINKGLLDKKASLSNGLSKDDFIIVKRNKITFSVENEELVSNDVGEVNNSICTGQINEDEDITSPKIKNSVSYTDKIVINFDEGSADSGIKNYKCLYGTSSSNINREGQVIGTTCELNNLKSNSNYYAFIYMNTNKGSSILSTGNTTYNTKDFKDMSLSQSKNIITINYDDSDVLNPSHYFKSNITGTTNLSVQLCTQTNNTFTCGESTKNIEQDRWYKVAANKITITYPEENNTVNITSRIHDGSNNYKEKTNTIEIKKHIVRFYKNTANSIDGSTNEYIEKYCIAKGNETCNITAPSITAKTGYSIVGWSNISTSTTSSWNIGISKDINSNLNYYAITKINTYTITYNLNGGRVSSANPTSYNVETNTITLNNPTKSGYTFAGWTGSNGTTQQTSVSINKGSTGNKNYTANWTANTYTVTYKGNTATSGSMSSSTATYNQNFKTKQNAFSKPGYKFTGWNEKADGTGTAWGISKTDNGTYESGNNWKWTYTKNITLYAQWTANTYTVTYNGNTATSGSMSSSTATYNQNFKTRQNAFSKTGYTFTGWNEKADGTGTAWGISRTDNGTYESGNNWKWTYTKNITLYAQWTANTYTLTYNNQNGSGCSSKTGTYGSTWGTLCSPTRSGYTFGGWYTSTNGGGTKITSSSTVSGNQRVYAKWTQNIRCPEHRYQYSSSAITVYHVGSCTSSSSCSYSYNSANGGSGTLTSTFYTNNSLESNLDTTVKYFNKATTNCYSQAKTSSSVKAPIPWCNTAKLCGSNTKDPNCISVWKVNASWYYSRSMCCYIQSKDLENAATTDNKNSC